MKRFKVLVTAQHAAWAHNATIIEIKARNEGEALQKVRLAILNVPSSPRTFKIVEKAEGL